MNRYLPWILLCAVLCLAAAGDIVTRDEFDALTVRVEKLERDSVIRKMEITALKKQLQKSDKGPVTETAAETEKKPKTLTTKPPVYTYQNFVPVLKAWPSYTTLQRYGHLQNIKGKMVRGIGRVTDISGIPGNVSIKARHRIGGMNFELHLTTKTKGVENIRNQTTIRFEGVIANVEITAYGIQKGVAKKGKIKLYIGDAKITR